jgi:uncharacterized integral membrane protein
MRFLTRLVGLLLAVLLLIGAILLMVGSRDPVTLRLALLPQEVQLPLFAAVLAAAVVGFVCGGIVMWITQGRWRRLARECLMELEDAQAETASLKADLAKAREDADKADAANAALQAPGNDNSGAVMLPGKAR